MFKRKYTFLYYCPEFYITVACNLFLYLKLHTKKLKWCRRLLLILCYSMKQTERFNFLPLAKGYGNCIMWEHNKRMTGPIIWKHKSQTTKQNKLLTLKQTSSQVSMLDGKQLQISH